MLERLGTGSLSYLCHKDLEANGISKRTENFAKKIMRPIWSQVSCVHLAKSQTYETFTSAEAVHFQMDREEAEQS